MSAKPNMIALWGILLFVLAVESAHYGIENNVKDLVARRKNLEYMKQLVEDIDDQLNRLHKRSCVVRLPGMDCTYKDINNEAKDQNNWAKEESPGKRSNMCDGFIFGKEGCFGNRIDQDNKDNQHWGDPDGVGRK